MANTTIWDLTGETAMTAAMRLPVQETSAATTATHATFALLGGLEIPAVITTDGAVNGVAGQLTRWDIDSITGAVTWDLPAAASIQTGEYCGVYVTSGSTTDGEEIAIHTSAAADLIDGVDYSSNEHTKIFQTGEFMIYQCVDGATADYRLAYDGRIPCHAEMNLSTDATAEAAGTLVYPTNQSGVWTIISNDGDCATASSGTFLTRRDGIYSGNASARANTVIADTESFTVQIENLLPPAIRMISAVSASIYSQTHHTRKVADGVSLRFKYSTTEGSRGLASGQTYWSTTEILSKG